MTLKKEKCTISMVMQVFRDMQMGQEVPKVLADKVSGVHLLILTLHRVVKTQGLDLILILLMFLRSFLVLEGLVVLPAKEKVKIFIMNSKLILKTQFLV